MRISIPIVGNSKWSKLISLLLYLVYFLGIAISLLGVSVLIETVLEGDLLSVLLSFVLIVAGFIIAQTPYVIYFVIARYVNYLRIKKEVKKRGLEPVVGTSIEVALQLYAKEPGRPLLRYIRTLNPKAAEMIITENPYAMETKCQMVKRIAGVWIAKIRKRHDTETKRQKIRRKAGYGCLAAGIVILTAISIYNAKCKYEYVDVPFSYKRYDKKLELNAYAEMNIVAALMIGSKEEVSTGKNGKAMGASSCAGLYYYVVDNKGNDGVVFFPIDILKHDFDYRESGLGDTTYECEIDVPVQVYGHIKEMPYFSDVLNPSSQYFQQEDGKEPNELLSEYALLSVDSLKPREPSREKVPTGKEASDEWIAVGIVFLIAFIILIPKKQDSSDWDE